VRDRDAGRIYPHGPQGLSSVSVDAAQDAVDLLNGSLYRSLETADDGLQVSEGLLTSQAGPVEQFGKVYVVAAGGLLPISRAAAQVVPVVEEGVARVVQLTLAMHRSQIAQAVIRPLDMVASLFGSRAAKPCLQGLCRQLDGV
jgi:hypothetical protein